MSKRIFRLSFILLVFSLLLSACSLPWQKKVAIESSISSEVSSTTSEITYTKQLKKFNNYQELSNFLMLNSSKNVSVSSIDNTEKSNNSWNYNRGDAFADNFYQADIIKTGGDYVYSLVKNELFVTKIAPAKDASVASKITFKSRPQGILLNGNNLAVFGIDNQIYSQSAAKEFRRQNSYTFFKVFDLSDPSNPKQVRDLIFEGDYLQARLFGDYVYLATSANESYDAIEPVTPRVFNNGELLSEKCTGLEKCYAPEVFYFDLPYQNYRLNSLTAINIKDNSEVISGQIYLVDGNQNIYFSAGNIYFSYAQGVDRDELIKIVSREIVYPKLGQSESAKIKEIELVPDYVLSVKEKNSKIYQIIDNYLQNLTNEETASIQADIENELQKREAEKSRNLERTFIHKFSVNGNKLAYRALGEAKGLMLNRFSLNEYENNFRLVTKRSARALNINSTSTNSYTSLYVFDADLKMVGSLENLETKENVLAARFIGARAYLMTSKPSEPLFVVNLSDPAKPNILNPISMTGISNYLHPFDKNGNVLISLGNIVDQIDGQGKKISGLKLSLLDFTDPAKPQELDSYLLGGTGSDSIVLSDPDTFFYDLDKNLLSIPAVLRDSNNRLNFAGTLIFSTANNQLTLKEKIDHSAGGYFGQIDIWNGLDYYNNTVKRSFYSSNYLLTLSNKFLKISSLADTSEIKSLELTSEGNENLPLVSATTTELVKTVPDLLGTTTPSEMISNMDLPTETPAILIPPLNLLGTTTP